MTKETTETDAKARTQEFVISRDFDAPRELVFKMFSDVEHTRKWWSPKGFTAIDSKMDFRVGGVHHYGLRMPDGKEIWGKQIYREITPPSRIVLVNSFADRDGNTTRHPLAPVWPLEMLTTFTFEDIGDNKTRFTVTWLPINAGDAEVAAFDDGRDSMRGGWTGTLDQLEAYLGKL